MDEEVVPLETMKSFYEQRATPEELDLIRSFIATQEDAAASDGGGVKANGAGTDATAEGAIKPTRLAPAEQFVYNLTTIHKFDHRMKCWIFRASFEEKVLDIMSVLEILACATRALVENEHIPAVLGLVLTLGNYLNGGTQRGQADGFNVDFLPKLRDVKTKDNSSTLIDFVVATFCSSQAGMGTNGASCCLPPAAVMARAAESNFDDLAADLQRLESETALIGRIVCVFVFGL